MAELNSLVRVGIVSAVDKDKKLARVYFPDMNNMVSGWLYVVQRTGESVSVASNLDHSHNASVSGFMPKVNAKVLVLYPYGWNMDGYVLGVIP